MTMVSINLIIFLPQKTINNFMLDLHSYLLTDVLEWVNQTLAENNLCIPVTWNNDLEQIYILLVSDSLNNHNHTCQD